MTLGVATSAAEAAERSERLVERLEEVTRTARTPEDALEPALRAILDDTGAAAGAISVFDETDESLRLVAEVGLAEEGYRRLQTAGNREPPTWDLPLQSIRTGRPYVAHARDHGDLPHLVESTAPVRALACVPLRVEPSVPVGSLLLVTLGLSFLTEADIGRLCEPLATLARLVAAVRQRAATRSLPLVVAGTRPPTPTGGASADPVPTQPSHVELLIASLAATERERVRLAAALEASESERTARAMDWAAESERFLARLDRAETALVHTRELLHERELRCELLQGELEQARAHQAELRARLPVPERPSREQASEPNAEPGIPAGAPAHANESVAPGVREVSDPPATSPEVKAECRDRVVVVVDVDPAWSSASLPEHEVRVIAPGADLARRLEEIGAGHLVANLAAPGVFQALGALRERGSTMRCWGCVGVPGTDLAIPLGAVEVVARSGDPAAILSALAPHVKRGARIMTVGADVDVFMSLRQALTEQGLSVSMAWDGHQAADLLGLVRPMIAVVDLGLPAGGGHATVARFGGADPIPTAIMLGGVDDPAGRFASACQAPGIAERAIPHGQVLAALVRPKADKP